MNKIKSQNVNCKIICNICPRMKSLNPLYVRVCALKRWQVTWSKFDEGPRKPLLALCMFSKWISSQRHMKICSNNLYLNEVKVKTNYSNKTAFSLTELAEFCSCFYYLWMVVPRIVGTPNQVPLGDRGLLGPTHRFTPSSNVCWAPTMCQTQPSLWSPHWEVGICAKAWESRASWAAVCGERFPGRGNSQSLRGSPGAANSVGRSPEEMGWWGLWRTGGLTGARWLLYWVPWE